MTKEINIVSNASVSKLLTDDKDVKIILTDLLSYFVAGHEQTTSFKLGRWDGKSTMFDWVTRTFPTGFMESVKNDLISKGYKLTHITKNLPAPLGKVHKKIGHYGFTGIYDYHTHNLAELERRGQMITYAACGAGKTGMAALAIERIGRPTLIITKRQPLMYQFWDRLREIGYKPGIIGDCRNTINPNLTVAMAQTLSLRINEGDEEVLNYLKTIEFVIGEEAHEVSDEAYWNVIKHCPNAHYRMGLTATPFMRNKNEANMKLLGAFGPLGFQIDEATLIDRGILAKPMIKYTPYTKPEKLRYSSNYQKAVFEGITHCRERNQVIVDEAVKAAKVKLPVMILVQRKDHGKVLIANLKLAGLRVEYIFGDTDSETRKDALKRLSTGKLDALIGSTIIDVGIDVPAIGLLINAGGGKGEVQLRQRIGRAMRAKKKGPNICFILDLADEHNEHLNNHFRERKRIVTETPGLNNIIDAETEFPYHLFVNDVD